MSVVYDPIVKSTANGRPTGQAGGFGFWRVGADSSVCLCRFVSLSNFRFRTMTSPRRMSAKVIGMTSRGMKCPRPNCGGTLRRFSLAGEVNLAGVDDPADDPFRCGTCGGQMTRGEVERAHAAQNEAPRN
jgi:hypothetical protein